MDRRPLRRADRALARAGDEIGLHTHVWRRAGEEWIVDDGDACRTFLPAGHLVRALWPKALPSTLFSAGRRSVQTFLVGSALSEVHYSALGSSTDMNLSYGADGQPAYQRCHADIQRAAFSRRQH